MNASPAIPRLNVPAYDWWNECSTGGPGGTWPRCFPQAIGMLLARSFDRGS